MDKHQRSRSNCKAGITVVWKYWCFSKIVKHDILSKTEKNVQVWRWSWSNPASHSALTNWVITHLSRGDWCCMSMSLWFWSSDSTYSDWHLRPFIGNFAAERPSIKHASFWCTIAESEMYRKVCFVNENMKSPVVKDLAWPRQKLGCRAFQLNKPQRIQSTFEKMTGMQEHYETFW